MTPGEAYCTGILVRVRCDGDHPFCAGLIFDCASMRCIVAAPILRHYLGQHADKCREGFHRMGWRATVVKRPPAGAGGEVVR